MLKRNVVVVFFCLVCALAMSQPTGVLTHFSHDGKLSQSRVIAIQQDEKGFIWLATFNGLIRYDGSTFQKFNVKHGGALNLLSNRVFRFNFDKNGRIWIQSEKNDIYYFDTRQLKFHYPIEEGTVESSNVAFEKYKVMPSGRVWLFPESKNNLIVFENNKKTKQIAFDLTKQSGKIRDVFEDKSGASWFLTDAGICWLKKGAVKPECFFLNMTGHSGKLYSFTSVIETNEDIWFGGDKGKLTRYTKKSNTFFDFELGINDDITQMELIANRKVLILTKGSGFYLYDLQTGKLDTYNSKTLAGLSSGSINFLGITRSRQFWFETQASEVFQFDLVTGKLKQMKIDFGDNTVTGADRKSFLLTSPDGTVWIQSKKGAFSYWDEKQNRFNSIINCIKETKETVSDVMHTAMFDKIGNLWFCSYKQGLDLITFNTSKFSTLNLSPLGNKIKHNVRSLLKDRKGNLWVASRSEKIAIFDAQKRYIGSLGSDGVLSGSSSKWGADIYCMVEDNHNRIWIGTRGNGLFCLIPGEQPFKYKVIHYKYSKNDKYSISSDDIYNVFQASTGQIYATTWGGGINLIRESKEGLRFVNYRNELLNYPIKRADKVRSVVESKDHTLFFISSYKLFSFSGNQPVEKLQFKEHSQVSGNDILDVLVTSGNQLAIATNGKGLILSDLNKSKELEIKSIWDGTIAFPMEGVVSMQEDNFGKIWLMGDNQVVRFDPKKNTAETFPELKSIIGSEIFSEATKCRLANGEIVLGYSNGVVYFKPETIKPFVHKPYLAISGFSVNNKELKEINPETPGNPDLLTEVTLEHDQNFFRVQFSALDYIKNENIVYRYKLEGVDKQWNYIKGGQSINYTNLSRGEYTLLISSTNGHNLWVDNERQIKITILPSIWRTNFAYFCYLLIAIGMFLVINRAILTILKLRNDVNLQKQMGELKLKFFTDISHEIRTPLTMITAPLELMLSDNEIKDSVKDQLRVIEKNSTKLLNLVNQILDLRRIQDRKLTVSEIDLGEFATKTVEDFSEMSIQRNIQLKVVNSASTPYIWADADSLDKILVNLLSNAFKYCNKGDIVNVSVEESDNQVLLKVSDNGPGISPVLQKRLFGRFANYNENPFNPSTGIGLSIVKDLAEKHGASVSVESTPGMGSSFQIAFLKGYRHFTKDVDILLQESAELIEDAKFENEPVQEIVEETVEETEELLPIGLVVEDDPELRAFMVSVLEKEYTILVAENGVEGHRKAADLSPNFIISDIMMPQMDGIEMLKIIRNKFATSHIPVILLSAKTAIESKLEGMEYGADDYITKPFNVSLLKARIKNVLEQRQRLQQLYSKGVVSEISEEEPLRISNKDHKFMSQVIELVKENMSKSDFSVDELGKLMCMSRASFFNKLKDLTGVSPVVFIRDMRLNEAANLIKNEDLLIKEICFEVGFNDLKYFGKCFREKFNHTPAEYRRLNRR